MLRRPVLTVAVLMLTLVGTGAARVPAGVDAEEFLEAAETILCDCGCHPQSVYDCECGRAAEMRAEIADHIRGGKTGTEVVDFYVARFGEQIRIAPEARGFNLIAWLGPGIAFLLAGAAVVWLLRRWRIRQPAGAGEPGAADVSAADEAYVSRLRNALEEYDR